MAVFRPLSRESLMRIVELVIAGACKISFEQVEKLKMNPELHAELLPIVRPTLQKIATIVRAAVRGERIRQIHLVGGTAAFTGIAGIMSEVTGLPSIVAPEPMLVSLEIPEPINRYGAAIVFR